MWSLQRGKKPGARRGVVQWYAVDVCPFVNVISHGGGGGAQPDLGLFFGRLLKKPDPKTMMWFWGVFDSLRCWGVGLFRRHAEVKREMGSDTFKQVSFETVAYS